MSMLARFVQVTPERLKELLADASDVKELFDEPIGPLTEAMQQGLEHRSQKMMEQGTQGQVARMLASSLASLDPVMRQAVEKQLQSMGVPVESLGSGQGGEAILKMMLQHLGAPGSSGASPRPGQGSAISLEKDWHGVHFLLCGEMEPGATVLGQAVLGGAELGDDFSGYGAARYFSEAQGAESAQELGRAGLEQEMAARFDPQRMTALGIYPVTGSPLISNACWNSFADCETSMSRPAASAMRW